MTILIVDDSAGVRRVLKRAVAECSTAVWECTDGEGALSAYNHFRPNVVLMDVKMPRMDGFAATRMILRAHPAARVIMVTDYDDHSILTAAYRAGACAFVAKQNLLGLAGLIREVAADTNG